MWKFQNPAEKHSPQRRSAVYDRLVVDGVVASPSVRFYTCALCESQLLQTREFPLSSNRKGWSVLKGVQMTANHALCFHLHQQPQLATVGWLLSENRKIEQEETRHKHTNLTTCTLWVIISELDVLCSRRHWQQEDQCMKYQNKRRLLWDRVPLFENGWGWRGQAMWILIVVGHAITATNRVILVDVDDVDALFSRKPTCGQCSCFLGYYVD